MASPKTVLAIMAVALLFTSEVMAARELVEETDDVDVDRYHHGYGRHGGHHGHGGYGGRHRGAYYGGGHHGGYYRGGYGHHGGGGYGHHG